MKNRGKIAVICVCVSCASGCSLFVSLDGLSDAPDAAASDGSAPVDGSAPSDGGTGSDGNAIGDGGVSADGSPSPVPDGSFLDDFNRPDANAIGNGWTEKNPAIFSLGDGVVWRNNGGTTDYPDNIVYRPANEDIADVEISLEIQFQSLSSLPQIQARIQRDTIANAGVEDAYILYLATSTGCTIARSLGAENVSYISGFTFTTIVVDQRYRMRLRVQGTDPVSISGYMEQLDTTNDTWTIIGQASVNDSDSARLSTPGSVGFSTKQSDTGYFVDNFMRTPL